MKILVLEYITGGGMAGKALPEELARAGEAMLSALAADLASLPQISLRILRDSRLSPLIVEDNSIETDTIASPQQWQEQWKAGLAWADAVWVVAPETDGILYHLAKDVLAARKVLLGCRPDAIQICSDKLTTNTILNTACVDSVPGCLVAEFNGQFPPPWIIKPKDEVGCEGIRLVGPSAKLADFHRGDWIIQPYIRGEPLSLSAVFAGGKALLLTVNRQHLVWQGESLELDACSVNINGTDRLQFQRLCSKIAMTIPGLWGYVGIDLIQSRNHTVVVEINPRLTLSYTGIRAALNINVAEWVVMLANERVSMPELISRRKQIGGKEIKVTV